MSSDTELAYLSGHEALDPLVGRTYDDRRVFHATMACEQAAPSMLRFGLDATIPNSDN